MSQLHLVQAMALDVLSKDVLEKEEFKLEEAQKRAARMSRGMEGWLCGKRGEKLGCSG